MKYTHEKSISAQRKVFKYSWINCVYQSPNCSEYKIKGKMWKMPPYCIVFKVFVPKVCVKLASNLPRQQIIKQKVCL